MTKLWDSTHEIAKFWALVVLILALGTLAGWLLLEPILA